MGVVAFAARGTNQVAIMDFGPSRSSSATTFISVPDIPADAHVRAWITGSITDDNDENTHLIAALFMSLTVGICAAHSGFRVYALLIGGQLAGKIQFQWRWA